MKIVPLREVQDESLYGGKALSLGKALRNQLPVPDGFALDYHTVHTLSETLPTESFTTLLTSLVNTIVSGPYAVRSSAVGEDSIQASFAGQHATVLNVTDIENLLPAIRTVYRSARTESAMAYRKKLGLTAIPNMAVVVQQLISPDVSGVMFTQNPVSRTHERVIEASWGLGEVIVSGLVTPDRYRLSPNGALLERSLGDKDLAIRTHPNGGTYEVPVATDRLQQYCLTEKMLAELHKLALQCDQVYQDPHDIEFAFFNQRLFLLQRRSITNRRS